MELVEQRLGNYYLNRLLGRGAFADIYVSTHIYFNSHVAIKVLHDLLDAHASLLPVQDNRIVPLTATRIDQKISGCSESLISESGRFRGDPLCVACQHPVLVIRVCRPHR